MSSNPVIDVDLLLVESAGAWTKAGSPVMICWMRALYVPGTDYGDGNITVLALDWTTRCWKEHSRPVLLEQAVDITRRLAALGIPGRKFDIEGVVDTSDGWSQLFFRAGPEKDSFSLDIAMHSSGFEGPHAEELRALFRFLFDLAGHDHYSPAIYGLRPTKFSR